MVLLHSASSPRSLDIINFLLQGLGMRLYYIMVCNFSGWSLGPENGFVNIRRATNLPIAMVLAYCNGTNYW